MPNREHIQWSSCMKGGTSYLDEDKHSRFTFCVISAMWGATECPNRDANCPLCSKFKRSVLEEGHKGLVSIDLVEYVQDHMKHDHNHLSFSDLPMLMINPVLRDVMEPSD